jgi:hypothetical protein
MVSATGLACLGRACVVRRVHEDLAAAFVNHAVGVFLLGRQPHLHPDNPVTGDAERFRLIKEACDTLTDAQKRVAYDCDVERFWLSFPD